MERRRLPWLAAAIVTVLIVQLGIISWLTWRRIVDDAADREREERIERRMADAMAADPVPDPTPNREAALEAQRAAVADRQAARRETGDVERIARQALEHNRKTTWDEAAPTRPVTDDGPPQDDPRTPQREDRPAPDPASEQALTPAERARRAANDFAEGPDHASHIRPVEPARNSVIITAPALTFAFELSPQNYDDGICLLANLSDGDYVVEILGIDLDQVLVDGRPTTERVLDVRQGLTLQALSRASIFVRPGKAPAPVAPENVN